LAPLLGQASVNEYSLNFRQKKNVTILKFIFGDFIAASIAAPPPPPSRDIELCVLDSLIVPALFLDLYLCSIIAKMSAATIAEDGSFSYNGGTVYPPNGSTAAKWWVTQRESFGLVG